MPSLKRLIAACEPRTKARMLFAYVQGVMAQARIVRTAWSRSKN